MRGGAGGLGDDEHAVETRRARAARAQRWTSAASRRASARTASRASGQRPVHGRAGRPGMPTAAERAGEDRGVDAAGLRPDADPGRVGSRLLEHDRDLTRLGLREQIDDPLRVGRRGHRSPRDRRLASVDQSTRPSSTDSRRSEHPAEQPQLCLGLRAVEPAADRPTAARRPPRARRDTASVRGVALGWANVAVSITMPGHQRGRQRTVARRRAGRRAGPASSATISHVAAAAGIDPVAPGRRRRSRRGGRW